MVWYGMVWYGMVWYGMVWYGMVWYGMVWYGMVWYGMVWYEMIYDVCMTWVCCGMYVMICGIGVTWVFAIECMSKCILMSKSINIPIPVDVGLFIHHGKKHKPARFSISSDETPDLQDLR